MNTVQCNRFPEHNCGNCARYQNTCDFGEPAAVCSSWEPVGIPMLGGGQPPICRHDQGYIDAECHGCCYNVAEGGKYLII